MPRIQMIRQKRPAARSEFYSYGVLPGSEMYPNTTWLDTKRFRGKNLLQKSASKFRASTNFIFEEWFSLYGDSIRSHGTRGKQL